MEKKNTHIKYGLITGIIMAVTSLVIYLIGAAFTPGAQYIAYIPFLVGIILNAMAYSKANDGFVTFGNVFGSGFKASMVIALVIVLWSIISMYAFPEMKEKAFAAARTQMAKDPKVTDDQIEMAMSITTKYWSTFLIAGAIFGTLIFGAVFALVGAAVAKKNGERPMTTNF